MTARACTLALAAVTALTMAVGCDRKSGTLTSRGSVSGNVPRVVISEIMANPRAVPDEHGEWVELHNLEASPVDLRGWMLASQNDRGIAITRSIVVGAG